MATLRTSIQMNDGMSGALRSMIKSTNILVSSFESMQTSSGRSIDVSAFQSARSEMAIAASHINKVEQEINQANAAQQKFNGSLRAGTSMATSLSGILGKIGATIGLTKIIGISDEMAQTGARLGLMNDETQTNAELQDKIFASAQRARALYTDTASAVAKMGLNAGNAFKGNDEVVAFMEQINKQFVISGASAAEQSNAMVQLTQAMASGALRGEELNSILDAAPTIARSIEKSMGWAEGSIKSYAEKGLVSASVVKNAMFDMADETNKKFESMPMTWRQVWNGIVNTTLKITQPLLSAINALANNWDILKPIVLGVAGVFIAATAAVKIGKAAMFLSAAATGIHTMFTTAWTAATFAATVKQKGLNAALLACPIVWIIVAIITVIALFYTVVAVVNKFAGTSVSATGLIVGAIFFLGAVIYDVFAGIANIGIWVIKTVVNLFRKGVYAIKAYFAELGIKAIDSFISVKTGAFEAANAIGEAFVKGVNSAIKGINWLIDAISKIPVIGDFLDGKTIKEKTFEPFKMDNSGLEVMKGKMQAIIDDKPELFNPDYVEFKNPADSFKNGYKAGEGIGKAAKDKFGGDALDGGGFGDTGAGNSLDNIDKNTGKTADGLEISGEDLKYLRDIAEREAVNRFTTADLKIEMTTSATIASNMDIDGVIAKLEEKAYEALVTTAEGVHV